MVIQENKQLGFIFKNSRQMQENVFNIHYNKYMMTAKHLMTEQTFKYGLSELVDFIFNPTSTQWDTMRSAQPTLYNELNTLSYPKHHFYVFSQNAITASKTIKVDLDKFEPGIIKSLPENKMCTFLCGPNLAFKYWYKNGQMLCMIMELTPTPQGPMFNYLNFRLRITDNFYSFPESDNPYTTNWKNTYFVQFLQLLFFVEFSKAEFITLRPNQNNGATKKEGKILNESRGDITIVNSAWNKIFIRDEGFTVSPHLRWQPYGPDKKLVKLIYISEFEKAGYERKGLGTIKTKNNES